MRLDLDDEGQLKRNSYLDASEKELLTLERKIQSDLSIIGILSPDVYDHYKKIENELHSLIGQVRFRTLNQVEMKNIKIQVRTLLQDVPIQNKKLNKKIKEIQPINYTLALKLFSQEEDI